MSLMFLNLIDCGVWFVSLIWLQCLIITGIARAPCRRCQFREDGSVPTLATRSSTYSMSLGRDLELSELATLMLGVLKLIWWSVFSVFLFQLTLSARKDWGTLTHLRSLSRKGWDCPRLQISQGKLGQLCRRWSEMGCMWHALDKRLALESWWDVAWFEPMFRSLDQCKTGPTELRSVDLCRRKHKRKQSLGMSLESSDSDQSHVQCACLIIRVTFWCHRFEGLWSAPACGLVPRSKSGITLKIQQFFIRIKPMSLKVRVVWIKRFDC